jgi:hypothetical protein
MINIVFVLQIMCSSLIANSYDSCKDILREGIRDTLASHNKVNHWLAIQQEFCSIAKENNLSENNFSTFARDYVGKTKSVKNDYGVDLNAGWKLLSLTGNYDNSNIKEKSSDEVKIDFLGENKKNIIDYYRQNCGNENVNESLRAEAILSSKIANPDIVQAWRACMLKHTSGFLVELVPSSADLSEDELEYSAVLTWQSEENTDLVSIVLTFRKDIMEVASNAIISLGNYAKVDICEERNFILKSGSNTSVNILHKNRYNSTNISIEAKNDRGVIKTHIITLPKKISPAKIHLDANNGDLHANSFWAIESYCNNLNCIDYMRNIRSERHQVGEDFMAFASHLEPGICVHCKQNKDLRFCFNNCIYITKTQIEKAPHIIIESKEQTSLDTEKYFYFYTKGRGYYSRIRITTTNLSE